jgi:DNA-binding beta-propeller fold protein YncE
MIIYYSVRLLEKDANMVTIDERNNGTVFRINTRSESVLQLAYYANQASSFLSCLFILF